MKLRFALTSAIGVAVLSQFAAPASAATLINTETFGNSFADSFNIPVGSPVGTLGAFTVTAGNVDLIGNGGSNNFYPGNGNYIDLNGNTTGAITSTTSFSATTFANGGLLTFNYGANGASKTANVSIGSFTLGAVNASQSTVFSNQSYIIPVGASGALTFASLNAGNAGIVLDNIQLSSIDPVAAVPEPFTIIGTLVGGSAAIRLRKKLKADSNV
jgi:hypothetical protein